MKKQHPAQTRAACTERIGIGQGTIDQDHDAKVPRLTRDNEIGDAKVPK